MWPSLLGLLSLGFCVSLRIWAAVGEYDKPSLSAWPSTVVPLGQSVTLRCHSSSPFTVFRLFKRDGTSLPKLREHQLNTFMLGPVTREHAGSYTCSGAYTSRSVWSTHSDPLQIVVTGVFTKPDISAHPGPIVRVGENVTIRCHSPLLLDKFMLHKKGSNGHFQRHGETFTGGRDPADFSIGPMTSGSAGTYRCYGSLSRSPYEWSAPSDPVDIVITGLSKKPSLSAQGGPVVRSGENVTLLCSSERAFDQFHLLREGENLGRLLTGGRGPRGALQAEFPLGPGTPAHSGVYRCYGSFTRSPYAWSDPSDPLLLSVTGSTTSTFPSPMDPHTIEEARRPQGHSSQLHLLLRLSVAFIYTSILLAVLLCHWLPKKCCNHGRRAQGRQNSEQRGRFFTTEPPGKPLNLFPALGTEAAGVPGVETGQDPPQSGSALTDKVLTQPRGTDSDYTNMKKAFSSSVTPTSFQVLSSVMWPGAMVLDRADVSTENSSGHCTPDH